MTKREIGINRPCSTSIYIVCEGSKSEPWFLRRYIEWAREHGVAGDYYCEIFPTPKDEEPDHVDSNDGKSFKRSGRKNSGRKVQGVMPAAGPAETPRGGNPLYWVQHGVSKQNSHSEVYVIFDKDGHPKMPEAFELADQWSNVNIILNSRSFEYYMLLHFENIYRAFSKTECGEKRGGHTRSFHCCLPNAVQGKECGGTICINGYARSKGYWSDSKDENTFLTACNIWRGMSNGECVRHAALDSNPEVPVYERNPYVEFQSLLARLLNMKIFRQGDTVSLDSGRRQDRIITRNEDGLEITNNSPALSFKLDDNWLEYYIYPLQPVLFDEFAKAYATKAEAIQAFAAIQGEKTLLYSHPEGILKPGESFSLKLFDSTPDNTFAVLTLASSRYLIFR